MKCKYYGDAWENCKFDDSICKFEGDWHKCNKLRPDGYALMLQRELEELVDKKYFSTDIISPEPPSYDYLKGFYDGAMAESEKK